MTGKGWNCYEKVFAGPAGPAGGWRCLCRLYDFHSGNALLLTQEQGEQLVLGTWEDPLGDYANYEFRADGTGMLGDVPVRWEVSERMDSGDDLEHDVQFWVHCTSMGQEGVYSICFDYYAETGHAVANTYGIYNEKGTVSLGYEEDLYPDVERLSAIYRYQAGSYELITLDTSNWETYFQIVQKPYFATAYSDPSKVTNWAYKNCVTLKPEYIPRTLSLSNRDYQYGCIYEYMTTPYTAAADYTARTITLNEMRNDIQPVTDVFFLPNEDTIMVPNLSGGIFLHEEDYIYGIELTEIPLSSTNVYQDEPEGTVHVITDYILHDCRGQILLLK